MDRLRINQENRLIMDIMIRRMLGMSLDEFCSLDYDEQQKLVREYYDSRPKNKSKTTHMMLGSGDSACFVNVKKGGRMLVGSGRDSIFVPTCETALEQTKRLESSFETSEIIDFSSIRKLIRRFNDK